MFKVSKFFNFLLAGIMFFCVLFTSSLAKGEFYYFYVPYLASTSVGSSEVLPLSNSLVLSLQTSNEEDSGIVNIVIPDSSGTYACVADSSFAQSIPPYINYQGKLVDQMTGTPIEELTYLQIAPYLGIAVMDSDDYEKLLNTGLQIEEIANPLEDKI
jgi:hypothetical protein